MTHNERHYDAIARGWDPVVNIADRRPIKLSPCPFCEGPPVPIVQSNEPGKSGYAAPQDSYGRHGLFARAFVFCHECGAQSPDVTGFIYDRADYAAIERQAVGLWQKRDARHRCLYDAGEARSLNIYPRPEVADAQV